MLNLQRPLPFFVLFALATAAALAQEVITNESVIKLHVAGLSAEVILAKIRSSQTNFDTSVDALVTLAETGISEEVIAEIAGSASVPSSTTQTVVVRQGASAAPNVAARFSGTPCPSPGIFVESSNGLREIDPTTYTQGKSGGHVLSSLTHGIKSIKSKAVIQERPPT